MEKQEKLKLQVLLQANSKRLTDNLGITLIGIEAFVNYRFNEISNYGNYEDSFNIIFHFHQKILKKFLFNLLNKIVF